jgi:cytochrome c oxidase cbb3-type subunit 3
LSEYRAEMVAAPWRRVPSPPPDAPTPAALVLLSDQDSLAKGRAIFDGPRNLCNTCHREDLGGLIGPNLTDDQWLHGCSTAELVQSITSGFAEKGMMAFGTGQSLSNNEVLQVVSYIVSKRGSHPASPKPPDPARDRDCK